MSEPYLRDIELVPNAADDASSSCGGPTDLEPFGGMPDKSVLIEKLSTAYYQVKLALHKGWAAHFTGKDFDEEEPGLVQALHKVFEKASAGQITVWRGPDIITPETSEDEDDWSYVGGQTIVQLCLGISKAALKYPFTIRDTINGDTINSVENLLPGIYKYVKMSRGPKVKEVIEGITGCDSNWKKIE